MSKGRDEKPHIGIFGRRNNGKSSLINTLVDQDVAIVSDIAGTTTDPVKKSIEIDGIGPLIIIDTAGIDDSGDLGRKRISKTMESMKLIDMAILLISENKFDDTERSLIKKFNDLGIPFIIVHNKSDIQQLQEEFGNKLGEEFNTEVIDFSTKEPDRLSELVQLITNKMPETVWKRKSLLADLMSQDDIVLLITPIDLEAPEGRMILPQVQAIRDVLDNDGVVIVLKETEVANFLKNTNIQPKLVITDSQVILKADSLIPKNIPLTGFSVLLAYHKGPFNEYLKGTPEISKLKDGDRVLILESCTHHVTCDDIGRIKIPNWLNKFTGKSIEFDVVAGLNSVARPITDYALLIQCGGCMITRKQLINRLQPAIDAGIPITNYGLTIAYTQGVYHRVIQPFVKNSKA